MSGSRVTWRACGLAGLAGLVAALTALAAAPQAGAERDGTPIGSAAGRGVVAGPDWPQWRGPDRNGIAPVGPRLADGWAKEGPARLWQSEAVIPSGTEGGYGSVVVAEGRVYVYYNGRYREPMAERSIADFQLDRLGRPVKMNEDLTKAVESARLSQERAELKGNEVGPWVKKWLEGHLSEEERKKFGPFAGDRLGRGKGAMPLDLLEKLAAAKGKEFATGEELEKWLEANGIRGEDRKLFLAVTPTTKELFTDGIVCLNAADGKTVWKKEYKDRLKGGECSTTPAVDRGRVYFFGCSGDVRCLEAADGKDVWQAKAGQGGDRLGSSVLAADGLVLAQAGEGLFAFDARDGKELWKQDQVKSREGSPVAWNKDRQTCLLCNAPRGVFCLEAKTGNVLWSAPAGEMSTPVISGDTMVIMTTTGLVAYRLSRAKPDKPLWSSAAIKSRGCSPIIQGSYVYATTGQEAVCVKLEDGKVAWEQPKIAPNGYPFGSPLLADGKILAVMMDGALLAMIKAAPEGYDLLARVNLKVVACTTPVVAGGRMYLRLIKGVACYDLTKTATTAPAGN